MIAYTEVEYGLFSWPITTATPIPAAAAEVLLVVSLADGFRKPPRVEKLAPRSVIANPESDLSGRLSDSGSRANAWGFA
jgi:hypothetical protein